MSRGHPKPETLELTHVRCLPLLFGELEILLFRTSPFLLLLVVLLAFLVLLVFSCQDGTVVPFPSPQ
jgi:hypothetical protein